MPSSESFQDIVARLNIDAKIISKRLGLNERNVRRWISGEKHAPEDVKNKLLEAFDPEYKRL